jgi:hypothetical protein
MSLSGFNPIPPNTIIFPLPVYIIEKKNLPGGLKDGVKFCHW